MGCISSKDENPAAMAAETEARKTMRKKESVSSSSAALARLSSSNSASASAPAPVSVSVSVKIGFPHRRVDAEQVSAGWPPWLSAAAGEAIHGWIPLRADSYAKLEKIGQGTYSSVFRAREVETGKMVALKKVRFDNYQPESVRFMAREILILRRLDHPNIMRLEGLITSGSSNSIYLVFEYMEHDLAGLVSSPDVKFTESQVKCYLRQLLSAVEHCHLRGIIHRDIKVSNILVNNEGILKLGDFGLANIVTTKNKQSLTSRVVTLWYRPPELLMGSTSYGVSVDLWSVGCVFAELFIKRPVLKGRTEVEQLHKIFKLCGSPSEDYWARSRLPHATMFKPQHPYESSLKERFRDVPTTALDLIETFLSVEPSKRGTASSALISQYFRTQPYACDPSSLPKYPPTKEMDAKSRDDAQKRKLNNTRHPVATRKPRRARKTLQQQALMTKLPPTKEERENTPTEGQATSHQDKPGHHNHRRDSLKKTFDTVSESYRTGGEDGGGGNSNGTISGPVPVSASSGFAWAPQATNGNRRKDDTTTSVVSHGSRFDPSFAKPTYNNNGFPKNGSRVQDQLEARRETTRKQPPQRGLSHNHNYNHNNHHYHHKHHESADFVYRSPELTLMGSLPKSMDFDAEENHIEFSGPLLLRPQRRIDDLLKSNENQIRQAARKSRFEREK